METSSSSTTYEKGQLYQMNLNDLQAVPTSPAR